MVTSIIILNWNGLRCGTCLAAIAENTLGDDYEVIVLDNGSESPELRTRSTVSEGALIREPVNHGFRAVNNLAARQARRIPGVSQ